MGSGPRIKVLYIAGSGRSGSTLLDNILGQVGGLVSVGELRFLWERGMVQDRLCGCGRPFHECPVWTDRLVEAFGRVDAIDPHVAMAQQLSRSRVRHIPAVLVSARRGGHGAGPATAHLERLERLYRAVGVVAGAPIVVDSSKLPAYGYLLDQTTGIDLHVLHLVRDPRAAAYSWIRKKVQPDRGSAGYMEPQSVIHSSVLWTVWNGTAEALWASDSSRYLRLRYEDLVANPRPAIERVLDFVGAPASVGADHDRLPFMNATTVVLGENHTVAGNPNRLIQGAVSIRADDEWVSKMPRAQQRLVTALTLPLLRRYGYPATTGP